MTIYDRIAYFSELIDDLQCTNSYNDKVYIVNSIRDWLKDDFNCILEVLNDKYVFGFKMPEYISTQRNKESPFQTIREAIEYLMLPTKNHDLSRDNIEKTLSALPDKLYEFLIPIVNKTLRLGIGRSLLDKSYTAPMLANKYEGTRKLQLDSKGYFVTEKLDGNRCIAFYWNNKWNFISRNGKPMYVDFDMTGIPKEFIYDGEVLSREQVELSNNIKHAITSKFPGTMASSRLFNATSGLINQHNTNKDLVYNIFDIQRQDEPYIRRREFLDTLRSNLVTGFVTSNVRIVPILEYFIPDEKDFDEKVTELLYKVTDMGGEGVMINLATPGYTHKRTKSLLKYKQAQTIDMLVTDVYFGQGKYELQIGGLTCHCITPDGKIIDCNVGTGLSDYQRALWATNINQIVGKIVEVEYFSLSQDEVTKGTNRYSLRFPRLKKVRDDKNTTSIY